MIFTQFEKFGSIGDAELRKLLAGSIFTNILSIQYIPIGIDNSKTQNFSDSINSILSEEDLRKLCSEDSAMAETITLEILDFINQSKRNLLKRENPYQKETNLLDSFHNVREENFEETWNSHSEFLKTIYKKEQFDLNFYEKEFSNSLDHKIQKKDKQSFESVKEHFLEKWNAILYKKQTDYELELIDSYRKKFAEDLYKRVENLNKLKELLEPFSKELGRLWDMSKGSWQRVNFNILKKYAELLEKDKALKELAEMLGRMRKAAEELEEELFTNTILKPEWKLEHAHKSELVGIHESDDLGSMIPSEIALLASTDLETIFLKKYTEKKLQTFEYQSRKITYKEEEIQDKRLIAKEKEKGPIIICVDTSGSMHGTPEQVAKTLCFAILKIAIQENRKCYLISFSTGIQTLNLTDLKNSLERLLDFLAMSFYGGTDAAPALVEALRMLKTNDYKEADVLMISDFVMSELSDDLKKEIKAAKQNKTKFHSLVIGTGHSNSVMSSFDNNWIYNIHNQGSMIQLLKNLKESKI